MTEERKLIKEMELRRLAEMLVDNPEATSVAASIFYDNAKHGMKRVSEESHRMISEISEEEEEEIPIKVLKYLKKAKNIQLFFEVVRKIIIDRLLTQNMFDEQIVKYIDCFDSKMLKKYLNKDVNRQAKKFLIMVCLDDAGIFYDEDPVSFMKLVKKIYSLDFTDLSVYKTVKYLLKFYAPEPGEK